MLNTIFSGIFDSAATEVIPVGKFIFCLVSALVIGLVLTLMYTYRTRYTRSFAATLAVLPAVVCVVIMMVNGNIGAGVAVAGAFSLVRFRSAQGSAKEIGAIFLAMGAGLIAGMGYIAYAALFTVIVGLAGMLYTRLTEAAGRRKADRTLHITIPEDLDYTDVFADIFGRYAQTCELVSVKTTNMGSLYRLVYDLRMKSAEQEKRMIDELRCRNGNLEISISRRETPAAEL